jgi:hypothetical protein
MRLVKPLIPKRKGPCAWKQGPFPAQVQGTRSLTVRQLGILAAGCQVPWRSAALTVKAPPLKDAPLGLRAM